MRSHGKPLFSAVIGLVPAMLLACGGAPSPGLTADTTQRPRAPVPASTPPSLLAGGCSDDTFHIDLAEMGDVQLTLDPEARAEQWRDALFPILLARLEATVGLDGLLISGAGRPLLRDDALAHVLEQPVGSTRAAVAESGDLVVLVEHGEPAVMQDAVLEAVDQEALHLGAMPAHALVYGYSIDERSAFAQVCELERIDVAALESGERGFRQATLRTPGDLDAFLAGGVDLLGAQCTEDGLQVTGRSRPRTRPAPITPEHIAALRRPSKLAYVPPEKLQNYVPEPSDELVEWIESVSHVIENPALMERPQIKRQLASDPELKELIEQAIAWKRKHRKVPTYKLVLSWMGQQRDPHDLGFSLDPKFRAKDAIASIDELLNAVDDPRELAAIYYAWNANPTLAADLVGELEKVSNGPEFLTRQLTELRELLTRSEIDPHGTILKNLSGSGSRGDEIASALFRLLYQHDAYQCARYDGPLQGTQTGMTMFYTDLLMKVWGGDLFGSAPEGVIPGFESLVGHELSSVHCSARPSDMHGRAWLGLREEQYVREDVDRVRFAPVAARAFARSSEHGAEYSEEVEAEPGMQRFYQWWNAHYARIAAWEPQYELLNQILKWSVVVQVATVSEHRGCAAFLEEIEVDRSHRFDRWVTASEELRWRGPVSLVHGDEEPTECIPVLRTRNFMECGELMSLSGGVSAASLATLAAKPIRRPPVRRSLGRLGAGAAEQPRVAASGRVTYEAVTRPEGVLRDVHIDPRARQLSASVDHAQAQQGTRHRYLVDGANARPVTRVAHHRQLEQGRLRARDTVNEKFGAAHLDTSDVSGNVVRARVERGELRRLGDQVSDGLASGKSLDRTVADMSAARKAWKLPSGDVVVVLPRGRASAPRYAVMSAGKSARGPPGGLSGHFGSAGRDVTITLVHDSSGIKDVGRAKEIGKSPTSRLQGQLDEALSSGDIDQARALVPEILKRAPEARAEIRASIEHARLVAARSGQDARALEELGVWSVDAALAAKQPGRRSEPGRACCARGVSPARLERVPRRLCARAGQAGRAWVHAHGGRARRSLRPGLQPWPQRHERARCPARGFPRAAGGRGLAPPAPARPRPRRRHPGCPRPRARAHTAALRVADRERGGAPGLSSGGASRGLAPRRRHRAGARGRALARRGPAGHPGAPARPPARRRERTLVRARAPGRGRVRPVRRPARRARAAPAPGPRRSRRDARSLRPGGSQPRSHRATLSRRPALRAAGAPAPCPGGVCGPAARHPPP